MAINPKNLSVNEVKSAPRWKQLDTFKQQRKPQSPLYSRFVRNMRLALPLVAIAIVGLLMTWPRVEDTMAPIPREAVLPNTVAKNELLDPHFESVDKKNQPFIITATRAVQSDKNPDMILLDTPTAKITLKDGVTLAADATKGAYKQEEEKLLLEGHVTLVHDQGYQMKTEKLLVDLKFNKAWSELPVQGSGPAGSLQAEGLQADIEKGILLFKGPAKLVLHKMPGEL